MSEEFDNLDEELEAKAYQAFLQFNSLFNQYIREIDPELWRKAVEFAKDGVDVPGVELRFIDEIHPETEE